MKWFYDLKISTKLILSFLIVALIAGIVGTVGLVNTGGSPKPTHFCSRKIPLVRNT